MKIVFDKVYLKISAYVIFTITSLFILYYLISNLGIILKTAWSGVGIVVSVLSPLIIALVITYLLNPLVDWIDTLFAMRIRFLSPKKKTIDQHKHLRRSISVLITYLLFLSVFFLIIYSLFVMISGSLPKHVDWNSMWSHVIGYANTYTQLSGQLTNTIQNSGLSDSMKNQLMNMVQSAQNFLGNTITGALGSLQIQSIGTNILNILFGLVISIYLLIDAEYFTNLYHRCTRFLINPKNNEKLSMLLNDIDGVVSKFIRGQLLVALIVGITSSIALYIVGLDYAVLVGMTTGLFNLIPYFGPLMGSILALTVGFLGGSPLKGVVAVAALFVIQELDSNIFSPKIVGDSVGLHPVFIMLALIVGGTFFGLPGMLLAVPVAGIIKLLLLRWVAYVKQGQDL